VIADWPESPLARLADIRVSNVDKKVHAAETPVRLCNYMDVYSNDFSCNAAM
jgi:type I restriction enzyme S subunit